MKKFKVVIVGGGSTWTPGLLKSLCVKQKQFPLEELRLFDIDAERQRPIGEFAKILFPRNTPRQKWCTLRTKKRRTKMWILYFAKYDPADTK